jgi:hypothetical protein
MRESITKQTAPEQAAELAARIIQPGDDEAAGALAALVSMLAGVSDEGARLEIAVAVAERAYTRTDACGNALLAFMRDNTSQIYAKASH